MQTQKTRRFTVKEWSWILYDWANSVYATNIMAAIFPIIFVNAAGASGDRWWSLGASITTLVVAVLSPMLGAIADFKGMKKKLFLGFMLLGVGMTAALAFVSDWRMMLAGYVLSHIGFSGANLFYDSFLTDVTTNERMDKVSSWGYAMGYIGGSTIPFVLSIGMLLWLGYGNPIAQKFAILITSLWWLGFSIPFLKNVHQEHYIEKPKEGGQLTAALRNAWKTAKEITGSKGLRMFVLAYFFYIDGVGTIISVSTAYGTALGLGAVGMILALLVTQIVAMPCAILFGSLAKKVTTRRLLLFAISIYMVICVVGFVMGYTLEPHQRALDDGLAPYHQAAWDKVDLGSMEDEGEARVRGAAFLDSARDALLSGKPEDLESLAFSKGDLSEADTLAMAPLVESITASLPEQAESLSAQLEALRAARSRSTLMFWAMAILVGTVQGGIQAVSRSYYGKLVPKKRSNEYFGFFDIFGKFATFVGPLLYALIGGMTGRSSYGTLALLALFLMGFLILYAAKEPLRELEAQRAAEEALAV